MVVHTSKLLLELFNLVLETGEEARFFERNDQTLLVTDLGDDLLPFFDKRSSPSVGLVLRNFEFCSITPLSELVESLTDSDFTLSFVSQDFDLFGLFDHDRDSLDQMAEFHVVECHISRHLKQRDELAPVLFLKSLTTAKLE